MAALDLDGLTDGILRVLVGDPEISRDLAQQTTEVLQLDENSTRSGTESTELSVAVEELVRVVDLATQTFVDCETSIYRFVDETKSPDATAIFEVNLQLQRLDSHPDLSRLLTSIRRVIQLAKRFPSRLASGCHVAHVLKLGTAVCAMLFRLQDNLDGASGPTLSRSASDFNRIVVERLEVWKNQVDRERSHAEAKANSPIVRAPTRRPFSQLQQRSPGGFLMSPELVRARQSLSRSRSATTPSKFRQSLPPADPNIWQRRRQMAEKMEAKWGSLLDTDHILRKTSKKRPDQDEDPATLRVAKRISSQVIRDLRKRLDGHSPLILAPSNHM